MLATLGRGPFRARVATVRPRAYLCPAQFCAMSIERINSNLTITMILD
jgi:hypothetical protein